MSYEVPSHISPQQQRALIARYDQMIALLNLACSKFCQPTPRLICISKYATAAQIATLYQHRAQLYFGENRITALVHKARVLKKYPIKWIYFGALQSRTIPTVTKLCHEIHSVASFKELKGIAQALHKHYQHSASSQPMPIFIQLNCGEPQKRGLPKAKLPELLAQVTPPRDSSTSSHWSQLIAIQGSMIMPPLTHSMHFAQTNLVSMMYYEMAHFSRGLGLSQLSMGMSMDWQAGIQAGATDIRIGRQIFDG